MKRPKDYATGKPVDICQPEEKVRQEFERILVKDYGYPKGAIDTEVPIQMGVKKTFCDIAVYDSEKKDNIVGIVEVKAPKNTNGREQLESYMSATLSCRWGVLTNGEETSSARKLDGKVEFSPAFFVPRYQTQDASIPNYEVLVEASNLKWVFKHINQCLYANTNLPRTEKQGAEMSRLIFCKLTDEYNGRMRKSSVPDFQIKEGETEQNLRRRINALWKETKEGFLGEAIFERSESIRIDDYSLKLIVRQLQPYSLLNTDRDVVGDAFEIFAERQFAGAKGQFFTPRNVVNMVIEMINPQQGDLIIDPACGSGGFLISAYNHMTRDMPKRDEQIKSQIAQHSLYGIDKDADLVKICKAQMAIIGDGKSNIVEADSLQDPEEWSDVAKSKLLQAGGGGKEFDVVVTNPPFGSSIKVERKEILRNYDLGHKWKKKGGKLVKTEDTQKTPPQVLFIEKCLDLLKGGGKLGIVLPDGLLGNPGDVHIRQHIMDRARVLAVIDCPTSTFMPHTGTKTSVLILQKHPSQETRTFFAIAEHCGHTMRGKSTDNSDFGKIVTRYKNGNSRSRGHLGFRKSRFLDERRILVPRYYDPRIAKERQAFRDTQYDMTTVRDLVDRGGISVHGMPGCPSSEEYALGGAVRFVRTSDIAGFEIADSTQKNITIETYNEYKDKQDLQCGDILFIKDGDSRIGNCAILLEDGDLQISVQSHFYKIRPLSMNKFLLLWALHQPIVKKQIRQRVFSQSTLSTIGERIKELELPIPKSKKDQNNISKTVERCIKSRREKLEKINGLTL